MGRRPYEASLQDWDQRPGGVRCVTGNMHGNRRVGLAEAISMKRFLVNAAQMSVAVSLGFLLSPVVVSTRHMLDQLWQR